ncbi:MAG: lytic murein transglycosylase [Coxiellaceae bacterium]|nr:lytic murein transglycosylase [Coxiellaceae bacterium]
MKRKIAAFLALLISFNGMAETNTQIAAEKRAFIQALVTHDHFDRAALTTLIFSLQPNEKIINTMTKPFEKQPWSYYRHFFLTSERIELGAQYLKTHHHELMQLQRKYGIPASIITAIIGVETEYGRHLGKYYVLDALFTLGFYYPDREKFFRKELGEYLVLTRDNHLPLRSIKGSYAGALGIPQFMPSSYRHFGVSTTPDGRVDLFNNADAIASVANYFHQNGWHANQPIAHQLSAKPDSLQNGAKLTTLPMKNGNEYWATYPNFNVIMTYNHNVVYAMAVYQLSRAIEKQYDQKL